MAIVLIAGATILIVARAHTQLSARKQTTTHITTESLDNPSEAPVTTANYVSTATGDEPKYITLPTIKAEGYIDKMGIDQYGAVAAPSNIHVAGWYVNSFKPGDAGLSVIDGHVDGQKSIGIFFRLAELKTGDQFSVELANGVTRTFVVRSVTTLPDADAQKALFARDSAIPNQLNLITCGGTFNHQTHLYEGRTVVVSALVS